MARFSRIHSARRGRSPAVADSPSPSASAHSLNAVPRRADGRESPAPDLAGDDCAGRTYDGFRRSPHRALESLRKPRGFHLRIPRRICPEALGARFAAKEGPAIRHTKDERLPLQRVEATTRVRFEGRCLRCARSCAHWELCGLPMKNAKGIASGPKTTPNICQKTFGLTPLRWRMNNDRTLLSIQITANMYASIGLPRVCRA